MKKILNSAVLAAACFLFMVSSAAWALPQFARKYNFDCSTCHWPNFPQLNKFGFEFRAAGYRPPSDIGKDDTDKFDWESTSSIKVGNTVTGTYTDDAAAVTTGIHYEFTGPDLDIMPFTGSFSKNWATAFDIMPMVEDGTIEFGRAFLKYVAGDEHQFFTARFGLFAPYEGYGAADSSVLLDDPLIWTSMTMMIPFTIDDDQYGLELGFTHDDTRITVAAFNGLSPTSGMGGFSEVTGGSDHNNKDVLAYVNQFIGDDGLALSGYFYNGAFNGTPFLRGAVYVTVPVGKNLEILGGGELGTDDTGQTDQVTSAGGFGSLEVALDDTSNIVARYDYFNQDTSQSQMDVWAGALAYNLMVNNHIKFQPEYQLVAVNDPAGYLYNHSLRAAVIFLY